MPETHEHSHDCRGNLPPLTRNTKGQRGGDRPWQRSSKTLSTAGQNRRLSRRTPTDPASQSVAPVGPPDLDASQLRHQHPCLGRWNPSKISPLMMTSRAIAHYNEAISFKPDGALAYNNCLLVEGLNLAHWSKAPSGFCFALTIEIGRLNSTTSYIICSERYKIQFA